MPPPIQPASPLARRPKLKQTTLSSLIDLDSENSSDDELVDPRKMLPRHSTQATQIAEPRTSLRRAPVSSPAPSISSPARSVSSTIEIPASSPFRQQSKIGSGRLASAMAPRGTAYCAPNQTKTVLGKRPSPIENHFSSDASQPKRITIDISDSSSDERADLKPTSFSKKTLQTSSNTSPKDQHTASPDEIVRGGVLEKRLSNLIYFDGSRAPALSKLVPGRTLKEYQTALLKCNENKADAANWLMDNPTPKKQRQKDVQGFIRSFAYGPSPEAPSPPGSGDSDSDCIVEVTPKPKPAQPRRRLQQGRRPQASPVSSPVKARSEEEEEPIAITDDDDTDEEGYSSSENHIDPVDKAARALKYLNECELNGLLAICGSSKAKKDAARAMIENRPFRSLAAAKKVSVTAQTKGRKSKAELQEVGEDIVYDVSKFIKSLDAIDEVVATCEEEGVRMKSITDHWCMDSRGSSRTGKQSLPIPREPKLLQGRCTMKSYQIYGLNWLNQLYQHKFGCILADDMGLGKTCQIISFIAHIVESYNPQVDEVRPWPNLIVVPPSTLDNWQVEFEKFAPGVKVTMYHGKDREWLADEIKSDPAEHHVVLTTYTQLGRTGERDHTKIISKIRPNVAIFDEGHNLKNSKTKLYKDLCRITANWRVMLTGTPVQNNLMEMINLLNFIQPELFDGRVETLKDLFDQKVTLQEVSNGAMLFSDRVRRARSILEPFILQRQKEHVLGGFPPKTSRVLYCDMDAAQLKIYNEYRDRFRTGKDGSRAAGGAAIASRTSNDQNNVWIQLRKAAIHSQLFRRHFTDKKVAEMGDMLMRKVPQSRLKQDNKQHLIAELMDLSDFELHVWCVDEPCIKKFDVEKDSWMESGKVQKLLELLRQFRKNGDRALIFTRFAKVIEILTECLSTAEVPHLTFQGSTAVDMRQDLIDEFNENKDLTAFLLTTGAGGTGINLASANKVIIFDQSDNPQDDVQAENRAHRFGQTRPVEVIRLISRDSIEELVYKACQKKLELAKRVTGTELPVASEVDVEAEVRQMMLSEESKADNSDE
ncbi:hypothetical protein MCOR27_004940 [Pyricularia oryzae]|nr:hypothetical protein MCOR01_005805 [Pyricularia oryzae]KAH9435024.1 hypothetical protein MCOR02_003985 [Pyricularia oryzae]KAI6261786.1 hypothetical protein MCOR19_001998 [Pyricularia oryzae]KAI6279822.1 hypothetical protein MCOR27_004940 [Pyricularia oryzae]KAI6280619.1 hypothetical protein MCOR26_003690 [Pyricularia oryzae]